jgi:prepilin-type N-terminal cleavage/methylation domain-containing protein
MTRIDRRTSVSITAAAAAAAAAGRRQQGFSMIEGLIAAALIGVVAVGVIPMFTRAMSDNMAGADYTRVTNYSKSKQEDITRMPYDQQSLVVQASPPPVEYLDPSTGQWTTTKPANPFAVWTRTTTLALYNIHDIDDDQTFNFPLGPGAIGDEGQILEATVKVASVSSVGPGGVHRTTIIRYLKAF